METLQPLSYAVITVLFIIAMITIVMRIWVRGFCLQSFGLDDWAMSSQLVFFTSQQAMLYFFLYYGGGLHITKVEEEHPEWLLTLTKGLLAEEFLYVWEQFSIKMCFLLFYFRLSRTPWFLYALWGSIAWHISTTIAIWLLYGLQCRPLAAFWAPQLYPGVTCLDSNITYFIPYSLNLFTDVLILILPISTIWTLNMSLQRRVAVLVVLTTGGSAVLTGGLRAIILFEFASSPDFTWSLGKMVIISNVELSVGILAANMPALKAFWTCWRQNKLGRGKGLSLSNGGSGRDEALSGSHNALEMNNRSNLGSRNDMGRAERLHSTESEEKLWDLHKPGMRKRDYEVSAQGQ